jgi:ABC-type glycerol-3-phosphate transport system permease component
VLLTLIAVAFLFPFAWMVLTAAKTDEEIAAGKRLPALPTFRAESPYDTTDPSGKPLRAALELFGMQVRSLDARVFSIPPKWELVSGETHELLPSGAATQWRYRVDRQPLIIQTRFDFPIAPDDLHKLILSLKPDDSWHRIDAQLIIGRQTWRSGRSTYLAQHRPTSILFQPPTFEDSMSQPKIWVPLVETPSIAALDGQRAALQITLTPSSTPRAIWGKLTRNYERIFRSVPLWQYVFNSIVLVALSVVGTLLSTTFVAYAFARLRWPGRSFAFLLLLATMMIPAQVTMIPTFLIWRELGWYNTLNPLWAPAFFGSAFFIFMMVQHMRTIPRELEEAARIDGLGFVQTWYYIILPQVKPAAAAVAVMTFLGAWNDFLGPLIYLRDQSRFPLSMGLFAAQIENSGDWTMIMAGNVLMTLPVIVLFFVCQRYFVQGVTLSGMK